ncbi:MAG: hypothetical protein Q7R59_01690 [bacterium]|nr:hypothetical protein [bacterium]
MQRKQERALVALEIAFGLYKNILGDDAHARKFRRQYCREVRTLLARAKKMGLGKNQRVRNTDLKFIILNP